MSCGYRSAPGGRQCGAVGWVLRCTRTPPCDSEQKCSALCRKYLKGVTVLKRNDAVGGGTRRHSLLHAAGRAERRTILHTRALMKPWSRKFQNVGILSSIPAHARALARGEAAVGRAAALAVVRGMPAVRCSLCVIARVGDGRTRVQVDAHFGDEGARHLLEHRIEDL